VVFAGADKASTHEAVVLCNSFMHCTAKVEMVTTPPESKRKFAEQRFGKQLINSKELID
jgi:hypothetical protein